MSSQPRTHPHLLLLPLQTRVQDLGVTLQAGQELAGVHPHHSDTGPGRDTRRKKSGMFHFYTPGRTTQNEIKIPWSISEKSTENFEDKWTII